MASSVAVGAWTLDHADDGTAVYAARGVLTPGERVDLDDLVVVEARVPNGADTYLRADRPLPEGAVVTRVVGRNELVPGDAIGTRDEVDVRPVAIGVTGSLSASVVEGALVDLWLTSSTDGAVGAATDPSEPALVAEALRVADVRVDESLFAAAGKTSVEVLVGTSELPHVLHALTQDRQLVLVPLPGGA